MKESYIQSKITSYLKNLQDEGKPIFFEKRQAGGFHYKEGIPDLYVVIKGRHIEIEIKNENGKRRNMQYKWSEIFKNLGIDYYICRDLSEFKAIISKYL